VAKDVIDDALDGYNGTIFAYGQTGSGKTYSMTGGGKEYGDRGIIPRAIAYLFEQKAKKTDGHINIQISYLEIYLNTGYNLLDAKHATSKLSDLPKVTAHRDAKNNLVLKGIEMNRAESAEEALQLMLIGDINRAVAQTPKNDVSTRSHCVFTFRLEISSHSSDVKKFSEVNLVDLSGSEQIHKNEMEEIREQEAISINMGLFHLERVILALHEKQANPGVYIPFRDSLLTTVLQESIGGNCRTRMLATVSAQEEDFRESISTCEFARRVAMIKNVRMVNESVNPRVIIAKLKEENRALKAEIERLSGPPRDHLYPN
jgi:kinesin family protein 6/9